MMISQGTRSHSTQAEECLARDTGLRRRRVKLVQVFHHYAFSSFIVITKKVYIICLFIFFLFERIFFLNWSFLVSPERLSTLDNYAVLVSCLRARDATPRRAFGS
jgi:hypothetical protein